MNVNSAHFDRAIGALAAEQHGNVTHGQLRALGLGAEAVRYRIKIGRLFRVFRGVYAVGRPPTVPIERAAAGVLACGEHGGLSHLPSLALWAFVPHWPAEIDVTLRKGDRQPTGITVHRPSGLHATDLTVQRGIRTTTPARTVLDCAPLVSDQQRPKIVNAALRTPFLFESQLAEVIQRYPRHPGARLIRPFVEREDGPGDSDWELEFPVFCVRFNLPAPLMRVLVCGYRVDALFETAKLIVELDGWEYHRDRAAFETDRERDATTLAAGYRTVRITTRRLRDAPAREAERLRLLISRASAPAAG